MLPKRRHAAFAGTVAVPEYDRTTQDDEWVGAIRDGRRSKGSFEAVGPLAQAVALACIALRVPYKRLIWDGTAGRFTNSGDANRLLRREAYRDGWESIVS